MKPGMIVLVLLMLTSCTSVFEVKDVSIQPSFKEWIGRKFAVKQEVFYVENTQNNTLNLMAPCRFTLPTVQEYRNGEKRKDLLSSYKVLGIAEKNQVFQIVSIGYASAGVTMGDRGVVLVSNVQSNQKYYAHESDLFSFENNNIRPHSDFIEILPAPQPAPDEKK